MRGITMNNGKGYYSVTIHHDAAVEVHTVFAPSDYAAAVKVRNMTGCMARSEKDVRYLSPHAPVWRHRLAPPPAASAMTLGMLV